MKYRLTTALRPALWHLLLSAVVAGLVALLVFGWWFPAPLQELVGGRELFWLIVSVDVVCGPLLTLVVFTPQKPRAELRRDLAFVVAIQLLALGYGVHTLIYARPVAMVHEVDRFRVLSFADLDEADISHIPDGIKPWGFSPLRTMGIREPVSGTETLESISASLQGVEPSQRPSWWQDYALSAPQALQRSHPLEALRAKHPTQTALLDAATAQAAADIQTNETADHPALPQYRAHDRLRRTRMARLVLHLRQSQAQIPLHLGIE